MTGFCPRIGTFGGKLRETVVQLTKLRTWMLGRKKQ